MKTIRWITALLFTLAVCAAPMGMAAGDIGQTDPPESEIRLSDSVLYLAVGEEKDITIDYVYLKESEEPAGDPYREIWDNSHPEIAQMALSGGEPADINHGSETALNQTGTIKGVQPGKSGITVTRSGFGASASATCDVFVYRKGDMDDKNSIAVTFTAPENRSFSPADFPGVPCRSVVGVQKYTRDTGLDYLLILALDDSDWDMKAVLETARSVDGVQSAKPNTDHVRRDLRIRLNASSVILKIGEEVQLCIDSVTEPPVPWRIAQGICLNVDPDRLPDGQSIRDCFREMGVSRFWPRKSADSLNGILEQEGEESPDGYYTVDVPLQAVLYEMTDAITSADFVKDAYVWWDPIPGEPDVPGRAERWESDTEDVVSLQLSGGFKDAGDETMICQTATVKALAPGTASVTVSFSEGTQTDTQTCTITVLGEYRPGDVNMDGDITAADALLALQAATEKVLLSDQQRRYADVDDDGSVTAADALMILQISTGKINL
ncbi:MAG: dockerin type I repeat-containing protein [Acutalibacteraceae bacterium]|jgi:hypothetical protein